MIKTLIIGLIICACFESKAQCDNMHDLGKVVVAHMPGGLMALIGSGCVDKGDMSKVVLTDGTELTYSNLADFNCSGSVYFKPSKEDIDLMKSTGVEIVVMGSQYASKAATVFDTALFKEFLKCNWK